MWQGVPFTIAFTLLTLGFQALFVLLCECETLMPKVTPLPQMSHLAMISAPPNLSLISPLFCPGKKPAINILSDFKAECKNFFINFAEI
jgi:hypothetical protein